MTQALANQILSYMIFHHPSPQIHLLLVGGNNLRGDWYPQDDPQELLELFAYLISEAKSISNCRILVSSLIPSIVNMHKCDSVFMDFDMALKALVDPEQEFLDLGKSLRKKTSKIKTKLYHSDNIHLDNDGTIQITKQIFNRLNGLSYNFS